MKYLFWKNGVVVSVGFASSPDAVIGCTIDGVSNSKVPDGHPADIGWSVAITNGQPVFTAPSVAAPKVSPVQFKLLFTAPERVSIKVARATDPVIDDFYTIIEDPRLTYVDLGLQSTKDAIGYLKAKNLLTADRATAILAGVVV